MCSKVFPTIRHSSQCAEQRETALYALTPRRSPVSSSQLLRPESNQQRNVWDPLRRTTQGADGRLLGRENCRRTMCYLLAVRAAKKFPSANSVSCDKCATSSTAAKAHEALQLRETSVSSWWPSLWTLWLPASSS